jgi:uncharacterized membrane protein YdjX (TVP38/TMEM64 family)
MARGEKNGGQRDSDPATGARFGALRRWSPLIVLVALMALAFGMGWHKYLSFKTVGLNYELLRGFIEAHLVTAVLIYLVTYIAVVALSLPGALVMTLAGGLLFGWEIGAPASIVAATFGATIIFLVVRWAVGSEGASPAQVAAALKVIGLRPIAKLVEANASTFDKLRVGFQEDALSYLFFLRLVPAFPFVVVNLAPAFLGVPIGTYVIATTLGIIPGTTAFSVAGSGLGSVVEAQNAIYQKCLANHADNAEAQCVYSVEPGALVTNELLFAFALLGVVALIPVAYKAWSKRHANE